MDPSIQEYHRKQAPGDVAICELRASCIVRALPEAEGRVWHAHPVWFLDGNPVVGYSTSKKGVRLLFWSGQSFVETGLKAEGKYKAAGTGFGTVQEIDVERLGRWLAEARDVQWDYKNLVRRKGRLERLK
ncbi:MAG: DUF1801 domain-containing protein [Verrucomicrobiales bacterium]|nr:DUF1801 domain-containing protein [Verrucomicrobiales bacterium]